jgi:transposase
VDELACFSEVSRERAFERFELLRVHLEDGIALAAIAREAKLSYRTLQHWLERYRTYGLEMRATFDPAASCSPCQSHGPIQLRTPER